MIPMADLRPRDPELRREIEAGFRDVLEGGQFVLGPNVQAFEEEVAAYLGADHAVTCGSGTDALYLGLRALGIGPGDEVITSPFSFFSTVEVICRVGARPVFADIDEATFNIDPDRAEAAVGPATRAILPVHVFGQAAAMERILSLARRHDLAVVEDCAQAFGARRGGRAAGTFGAVGCFSFFPSKNLGAYGDGGMVISHSAELAQRLRELRNHAGERHRHYGIGLNSRLDELQAVVLRAKLKRIERYLHGRRRAARRYGEALASLPDVVPPREDAGGVHAYNYYTILVPDRDAVQRAMLERGVATAVHYALPLHRQPALAADYRGQSLPVAEAVAERCLSLPMFPELSDEQLEKVVDALREALRSPVQGLSS